MRFKRLLLHPPSALKSLAPVCYGPGSALFGDCRCHGQGLDPESPHRGNAQHDEQQQEEALRG